MDVTLIISLLLLQLLAWVSCKECPPPKDIYPCECSHKWVIMTVECRGSSWNEIYTAFNRSLRGKTAHEVKFWNVTGDRMPSDLLRDTHVVSLNIDSCDLQDLRDTESRAAFVDLENSLEYLFVWHSIKGANQLRKLDLSHLKRLKVFSLAGNNIPEVGNDWFVKGPLSLTNLFIERSGLSKIGDTAFAPLVNLRYLYLSGNDLAAIQRSMFPNPASDLRWWKLDNNNFTGLPNDIFSGMPSLDTVILRGNSITRIEETTWSSVWEKLHTFDIYNNPLECDSHMDWMFKLKQAVWMYGTCASPDSQKGVQLEDFIESNRKALHPKKPQNIVPEDDIIYEF